jgi:uncharacterized 2Fe-2S/4Fe-4S cluster protein (DUF4445 family)
VPRVTFQPSGRSIECVAGTSLLDAAIREVETTVECCGKKTLCGLCKATVLDGLEHLSAVEPMEADYRRRRRFLPFERLGCMAAVSGDVEVELAR